MGIDTREQPENVEKPMTFNESNMRQGTIFALPMAQPEW